MILFISDIHLGRSDAAAERAMEADLIGCLRAHEGVVERLYIMGDLFDQYIEYRHLIPKGFLRLQGFLTGWADRGIPITYIVGNHDPWHRDYFQRELGIRVVFDEIVEPLFGHDVYMAHGDGFDRSAYVYNRIRPLLRHRVPIWLYTNLLPGDVGLGLAKWVKGLKKDRSVKPVAVESLREHARTVLHETPADVAVMGHTHSPELTTWSGRAYLNTGYWRASRTFGCMDSKGISLVSWNGTCPEIIETHSFLST